MHPRIKITAYLLIQLILMVIPLQGVMAKEATSLKAVLFYPSFCEECPAVIDDFLFPLSATQGEKLELYPVDITEPPGDTVFKLILDRFGDEPDSWNRPAVLVGGLLLRGKSEIIDGMPPLLAGEQTAEFTAWPDLPELQRMISGEDTGSIPEARSGSDLIATGLAWTVMISMLLALGFTTWRLVKKGRALLECSPVQSWGLPLFVLIGLGIGVYLSSVALTHNVAMCGPIGDCATVQSSSYSKMLGIPMSTWGLAFYLGILLLWLMPRFLTGIWSRRSTLGLLAFSIFGVMFSIYLTNLELFVIHAVCIWCLTSAVLTTLIMLIVMLQTTRTPST